MAGSTGSWNSSPRLAMLPAIIQTSVPDLFGHALEPAMLFADLQCFVGLGVEGAIRRPDQAPAPGATAHCRTPPMVPPPPGDFRRKNAVWKHRLVTWFAILPKRRSRRMRRVAPNPCYLRSLEKSSFGGTDHRLSHLELNLGRSHGRETSGHLHADACPHRRAGADQRGGTPPLHLLADR